MRPPGYEPGELPTAPRRDIINSFLNCVCKGTTFFDNRQIFLAKSYLINNVLTLNKKNVVINDKYHLKQLIKGCLSKKQKETENKIRPIPAGQIGHIKNQLLFQKLHDLLKIALGSLHTVVISTIPGTNRLLNAIKRIVDRLHQEKHLLRFRNTISIC